MALVKSRKGIGGRKPTFIPNPFVIEEGNVLFDEEYIDQNIDDIITGCVRNDAANRDDPKNRVSAHRVLSVYRNVSEISRQSVEDHLRCSRKQAEVYIQVIKDCNFWISRHIDRLASRWPDNGRDAAYFRYADVQRNAVPHYMGAV